MGAGFLRLVFDPYAWVVLTVTALTAFSGGVIKGWNWSEAGKWHDYAIALEVASKKKDELLRADVERAEADRVELARLEETLDAIIHTPLAPLEPGKVPAPPAPAYCKLSLHELDQLRVLASGNRKRLR